MIFEIEITSPHRAAPPTVKWGRFCVEGPTLNEAIAALLEKMRKTFDSYQYLYHESLLSEEGNRERRALWEIFSNEKQPHRDEDDV